MLYHSLNAPLMFAGLVLMLSTAAHADPPCDLNNNGINSIACGGTDCDDDGDGHAAIICGGDDCDEADANRFPGNVEICDDAGHDEDCDVSSVGFEDADGDGFMSDQCCNGDYCPGRDCSPARADINPIAPEVCNGYDDNCDGDIDGGLTVSLFIDFDRDGYGSSSQLDVCGIRPGFSAVSGDCDDKDATVFPQAMYCDGDARGVIICGIDGQFVSASCAEAEMCVEQPTGYGVCVPEPADPPPCTWTCDKKKKGKSKCECTN